MRSRLLDSQAAREPATGRVSAAVELGAGIVRFIPFEEAQREVQHVGAGFLDGRPCRATDLSCQRLEIFKVVKDREESRV